MTKEPGGLREKSLLVLNSFQCHKSDDVKELLCDDHRTRLAIIPGGMTSVLQSLDISVNKHMTVLLQRKWNNWYASDSHSFTASGGMIKLELLDLDLWMDHQGMGRPSYHHQGQECCISSKLDGTENVIVWEDYVKTRDPAAVADDDSDNKVHYSEEDALILQKFCSEGESHTGDTNLWTATRAVAN